MPRHHDLLSESSDPLELAARRRAGMKLGWYIHAFVYLVVNAGLMMASFSHGRNWAWYPALFWGLGLLAHGASVWLRSPTGVVWNRMLEREREHLRRARSENTPRS